MTPPPVVQRRVQPLHAVITMLLTTLLLLVHNVVESVEFYDHASGDCSGLEEVMTVNVGYYQSWAVYRDKRCFPVAPEDLDVQGNGYTHVAYSFASINSTNHLEPWVSDYEGEEPLYARFNGLKQTNPGLRTLIAIGGWTFNNPGDTEFRFSYAVGSAKNRTTFATSCVEFCQRYGFDGVDLDWEFPGDTTHGGREGDYTNYALLVVELRQLFDEAGFFVLTVATPVGEFRLNQGFDLATMSKGVDFYHLMTYNIYTHFSQDMKLGANTDMPFIMDSIQFILDSGVPANLIVLGFPGYGRTYELEDPDCFTDGCSFVGPALFCGDFVGNMPVWAIDEIVASGDYKSLEINPDSGGVELYVNQSLYISYDNAETYANKYDYATLSCFRGVMWWSADMIKDPIYMEMNAAPSSMPVPTTDWPSQSSPSSSPSLPAPSFLPTLEDATSSPTTEDEPTSFPTVEDEPTSLPIEEGTPTKSPTKRPTKEDSPSISPEEETRFPSVEFVDEPTGPLRPTASGVPTSHHCQLFFTGIMSLVAWIAYYVC